MSAKQVAKNRTNTTYRSSGNGFSYFLIIFGIVLIALSLDYSNQILFYGGTSLLFFGGVLFYIRPYNYTSSSILNAINLDYYDLIESILINASSKGDLQYYSPKNLWGQENTLILIQEKNSHQKPVNGTPFTSGYSFTNQYTTLNPPGHQLSKIIEKRLNIKETKINTTDLRVKLEKILIEELNLCDEFNLDRINDEYHLTLIRTIFQELHEKILQMEYSKKIGDPLTSAIACILNRIEHKTIIIESYEYNADSDTITSILKIMDDENGE